MHFQLTLYFWILLSSSVLTAALAALSWKKRHAPGGMAFILMMAAVSEWALAAALEAAAVEQGLKIFLSKWEYLGSNAMAVFFLIFSAKYTNSVKWLNRHTAGLLWVVPFINLVLVATNELHGWLWRGFEPSAFAENITVYQHGPCYFGIVITIYAYLAAGTFILIRAAIRGSSLFRRQLRFILIAAGIPWIFSFIYLSDPHFFYGLNIIPTSLLFSGIFIALSLFRDHLFDIIPVGRDYLLNKIWDGMVVLDSHNVIVDINAKASQLLGLKETEAVGKAILPLLEGQDGLIGSLSAENETDIEIEWTRANQTHAFEVHTAPLKRNETDIGRVMVWHDITELKKHIQERERLIEELREANASKNRFFSIISHDLRRPFNNIASFVRLINRNIDDMSRDKLAELSHELELSAKKTRKLLEDILEWSRSQTDALQNQARNLNLKDLVSSAVETLTDQAKNKEIRLNVDIDGSLLLFADLHMTTGMIQNLISNGIKFTPRGGQVTVSAARKGGEILIEISDTGVGMDKDDLDNLFKIDKSFSRAGTEDETGSGLGLILCQEFAEKQNGKITVTSTLRGGSVFTIVLPAAE